MNSIKSRFLLALVLSGLIPVALMLVFAHTQLRNAIIQTEYEKVSALGDEVARQIRRITDDALNDLNSLASSPILLDENSGKEATRAEFLRLTKSYDNFSEITLLDRRGFAIVADSDKSLLRRDTTEWFKKARGGERYVSEPLFRSIEAEDGNMRHLVYVTTYIPVGKLAIVRASIKFDNFWQILDDAVIGRTGLFRLIDESGNMLSNRNKDLIFEKFDESIDPMHWKREKQGEFLSSENERHIYQSKVIAADETGFPKDLILLCYMTYEEASAVVDQTLRNYVITGVVTLSILSLSGLFFAKGLSRTVRSVSDAAQSVARGELETEMPESGVREMRGLAISFNQMVSELKDHRAHLEALVESRTERLRESQADLEDLAAQLRATYESTPEAIIVVRPSGEVLAANKRVREFFGLNGAKLLQDGLGEKSSSRAKLLACFENQGQFASVWNRHTASSGLVHEEEWDIAGQSTKHVAIYSAPVKNSHGTTFARLWMFRDMTDQRRLEQGLQQAQKMEAIGRLSGGVAHDFNNLLTGIIGNLSLSELLGDMPKENEELVLSAKRAAERAAGIVKQLLTFSRQNKVSLRPWSANVLVEEVQEILNPGLDPSIKLSIGLDASEPYISADGNQIDQVLMNFCVNARDALPEGGEITVSTATITVGRDAVPHHSNCELGEYVKISVRDTGTGMAPSVREKIFEPFFTTKEQGKGTGLGLATSYGIVQEHSGWIDCETEPGEGTTFTVYIPQCERPEEHKPEDSSPVIGGDETVLVVDDELIVRTVAENVLRRHGYTVTTAQDGKEALEVVAREGNSIDLIMLDLTMPRMSGRETFRELRSGKFSNIPVVICSGYLVEVESFAEEAGSVPEGVVQKPYRVEGLAREIRRVLDLADVEKPV